MINLTQYFMGRDETYKSSLTDEIRANAANTVKRANDLLEVFYKANPSAHLRTVNSGWRPPALNARVPGAAPNSQHTVAKAVDLSDDDGALDAWLMTPAGQAALMAAGLWMEHPNSTPRWSHVQTVAPRSGRRVFIP